MKEINVMLDEGAIMPTRAHAEDAGLDLYTHVIDTGVHTNVPGIDCPEYFALMEIPKGYVGMIKSKSGLNVNNGIIGEGVIDAGYTGSIKVKLYNLEGYTTVFKPGDKIAQLVILPIVTPTPKLVDKFAETERGDNGLGSTGR